MIQNLHAHVADDVLAGRCAQQGGEHLPRVKERVALMEVVTAAIPTVSTQSTHMVKKLEMASHSRTHQKACMFTRVVMWPVFGAPEGIYVHTYCDVTGVRCTRRHVCSHVLWCGRCSCSPTHLQCKSHHDTLGTLHPEARCWYRVHTHFDIKV